MTGMVTRKENDESNHTGGNIRISTENDEARIAKNNDREHQEDHNKRNTLRIHEGYPTRTPRPRGIKYSIRSTRNVAARLFRRSKRSLANS